MLKALNPSTTQIDLVTHAWRKQNINNKSMHNDNQQSRISKKG